MKIIVLTAVWQRHELFEIFKQGFERIKKDSEHELKLVTIGSENIRFSDLHIEAPNQPLSNKWQSGINYIKDLEWDYVLILGSDDLICSNLLKTYTPAMEKGFDLIGLIDCYFLDSRNNSFNFWKGYTNHRRGESIGMARMLSRDLLMKIDWQVWSKGLKNGLDFSMMQNISKIQYSEKVFNCKKENIAAIDIKTEINVSNINHYNNLFIESFDKFDKFVSEDEFYSTIKLNK
jgi:hypothetical protein